MYLRKLEKHERVIQYLPDFVSQVFYKQRDMQLWMNDMGIAFGDSVPHTPQEIRRALDFLVAKLGGTITWSPRE